MAAYYYLMSSLPMLRAEGPLSLTYAEFLGMCKSSVSGARYALLEGLTLSSDEGPLLAEWSGFYRALQRELTRYRNQRAGRPPQKAVSFLQMIITRFLSKKERKSPYSDVSSFITTKAGLDREAR